MTSPRAAVTPAGQVALEHVAHQVLAQRDWYDDRPASNGLGAIPQRAG